MSAIDPNFRRFFNKKGKILIRWAEDSVVESDRRRFVSAAEETLAGIHEGNFARYRVRPSEFEAWQTAWREPGNATP